MEFLDHFSGENRINIWSSSYVVVVVDTPARGFPSHECLILKEFVWNTPVSIRPIPPPPLPPVSTTRNICPRDASCTILYLFRFVKADDDLGQFLLRRLARTPLYVVVENSRWALVAPLVLSTWWAHPVLTWRAISPTVKSVRGGTDVEEYGYTPTTFFSPS